MTESGNSEAWYIRGIRTTGRAIDAVLGPVSHVATMFSGVAILLGLGLGGAMVGGIIEAPTWDNLKDWVHNNLANNQPQ